MSVVLSVVHKLAVVGCTSCGLQLVVAACLELELAACFYCRLTGLVSLPPVCSCRGLRP